MTPGLIRSYRHHRGDKAFIPLREAINIGIMADLRNPDHVKPVTQFARTLHRVDRKCHIFFIIPEKRKELNVFEYEKHFPGSPVELVCPEELNCLKVPRKLLITPFASHHFDILFYLETAPNFTLEYVLLQTKAKMTAGAAGLCSNVLDFEIEMNESQDLNYLSENLLKYLQLINTRQEKQAPPQIHKLF
ncbi:MAG: hypothetical protein R6V75_10570 [Bacteroidales bacterium]